MKQHATLEMYKKYQFIDCTSFNKAFQNKIENRVFVIDRIYKRLGASERSFICTFLPASKRQKPFEHHFLEFEKLAEIVEQVEINDLKI